MANILEKEWAAFDDDEKVLARADTESALKQQLEEEGLSEENLEIIAVPKSHNSLYI